MTREATRTRDFAREFTVASTLGGALEEEDEEEEEEQAYYDGTYGLRSMQSTDVLGQHQTSVLRSQQTEQTRYMF